MNLASAAVQGNPALAQFVFSVGSGLTVVLLAYLTQSFRKLLKQHNWLIEQVNTNSEAIKVLLEDRKQARRQQRRAAGDGPS